MSTALRSISCPRCAGPLAGSDGERFLRCGHCGTPFVTRVGDGYARRFFPTKVDRLKAVGAATAWLRRHPDAPDDIREAAFVDAHLLYVPIWEVRSHVVGWEFGKKLRARAEVVRRGDQDSVEMTLVEEGVEEGFLTERRMYQEAADLDALGMRRPHVTGRETTLPYLPGELEADAAVLQAVGDLDQIRARARAAFLTPPTGAVVRSSRLFLLKERSALIYYPLWALRYRYRGRLYEMTVDGRSGEIHAARAPSDNRRRVAAFVALAGALGLAMAVAAGVGESSPAAAEVALYVCLLILLVASGVAWRFTLVHEVEYHEPFAS